MNLDLKTIQQAIKQIATEKGLSEVSITETINSALAAAYRKDFGHKNQNIIFEFDLASGEMKVFDKKVVVDFPPEIIAEIDALGRDKKYIKMADEAETQAETEIEEKVKPKKAKKSKKTEKSSAKTDAAETTEADAQKTEEIEFTPEMEEKAAIKFNPKTEMLLEDAKKIKKSAKVGDELIIPLEIPSDFGRMAAQTAKQVIIQKIREAERENVFTEFKSKEGELLNGIIQRKEMRGMLVDFGKVTALMPMGEQVRNERYVPGERMKFYITRVEMTIKGPEIIVSRASAELLKKLFENEIPEISNKSIEIMGIAREAGARSKVAVKSNSENIDPIGSCVGQRGARIQTIINELGGEKVDIIQWNDDPRKYISNALSPAKVVGIEIDEKQQVATVMVLEDQLSLSIGKEGQNVRLAAKLTGWKINIIKEAPSGEKEDVVSVSDEESTAEKESPVKEEKVEPETEVKENEKKEKRPRKEKAEKIKKSKN